MVNKLFPYQLQLHIFQLDEYSVEKFFAWIFAHFFTRTIENKKPLIWTQKAKALHALSIILTILAIIILTILAGIVGFAIGLVLATQPYIFLVISYYLLLPYEIYQKNKIKTVTQLKIASFNKLKIIGITGSYGKTSVKEILYHILKTEYEVLKTPQSYNTPYGIAKVVDLELDDSYEYFICEMGAYRVGEIKEICDIVHPTYGIVTGINEQHIETFGSLKNTTKGKFELVQSLPRNGFAVVNGDNSYIKEALQNYDKHIVTYGLSDKKFSTRILKQTTTGSEFLLVLDGKTYMTKTKLLGNPYIQNILAAATMSFMLGMKPHTIVTAIASLQPVSHRLEIKQKENMTIINDAYNSNVDGFKEAIVLLNSFKQPTIFVTPGIVGLGEKTLSIHKELGALLQSIDHIILIGNSDRTKGLKEGIQNKKNVVELNSINDVWEKIEKLSLKHPVILLENDLPDNY